jgi:hypothetical protein
MKERMTVMRKYFQAQNESKADEVSALFVEDAEVYNVNLPPFRGKDGVKSFCQNLYERTASRQFQTVDIAEGPDFIMAEWQVKMTFRQGAKIGNIEVGEPFDVQLRGINKFEFLPNSDKIRCLRIYHETSSVSQKAQQYAKK